MVCLAVLAAVVWVRQLLAEAALELLVKVIQGELEQPQEECMAAAVVVAQALPVQREQHLLVAMVAQAQQTP
jgi:hypothetical protein